MADNWRVLDFTHFEGELRFDKRTRKMQAIDRATGEVSSHALPDVNIVFVGIGVRLSSGLAYHLARNDVVAVFCDWKGMPISSLYPWIDAHGRVAARQRAQASLSIPRSKNAWMRIVKAKIAGQANVLEERGSAKAKPLKDLSRQVRSGDIDNKEGQAARIYWKSLFEGRDFTRKPGAKEGGANGLLDYGYTILRGHSMRAVLSAGLTPALGLYHKGRSNAFALADDLIEPFRPVVDRVVALLPESERRITKETRLSILSACNDEFGAMEKTTPTIMKEFAQHYGQYVEGDIPLLNAPVFKPRDGGAHESETR